MNLTEMRQGPCRSLFYCRSADKQFGMDRTSRCSSIAGLAFKSNRLDLDAGPVGWHCGARCTLTVLCGGFQPNEGHEASRFPAPLLCTRSPPGIKVEYTGKQLKDVLSWGIPAVASAAVMLAGLVQIGNPAASKREHQEETTSRPE